MPNTCIPILVTGHSNELALRLIFAANILVAGVVGVTSAFFPQTAARAVFSGSLSPNHTVVITGSFWIAIAVCSALGLRNPLAWSPVLFIQLLYKGLWLILGAAPVWLGRRSEPQPEAMNLFFLIWVVVLLFVIPWRYLLGE
jgi:hypothetical protein